MLSSEHFIVALLPALTSFSDVRDTTAAVEADPDNLGTVDDPDRREQYAAEARRMRESHDPDDVI